MSSAVETTTETKKLHNMKQSKTNTLLSSTRLTNVNRKGAHTPRDDVTGRRSLQRRSCQVPAVVA